MNNNIFTAAYGIYSNIREAALFHAFYIIIYLIVTLQGNTNKRDFRFK